MKTHPQYEPWLQGMLIIAKYYRLDFFGGACSGHD